MVSELSNLWCWGLAGIGEWNNFASAKERALLLHGCDLTRTTRTTSPTSNEKNLLLTKWSALQPAVPEAGRFPGRLSLEGVLATQLGLVPTANEKVYTRVPRRTGV